MELRHLRSFVAVAEELNFTRAATRLHIAQPPLSQQIRHLEREIGTRLFDRTTRRVELTPAGQVFLEEARATIAQADRAVQRARGASGEPSGPLALAFIDSATQVYLPVVLGGYRRRYPHVRVTLVQRTSSEVADGIACGRLDVGLLRPTHGLSSLALEEIGRDELVVALPESHQLCDHNAVSLQDLAHESFVLFPRTAAPLLHATIFELFDGLGFVPRITDEAHEGTTVASLVAAGLGVSVTTQASGRHRVVYRPIQGRSASIAMCVGWRRSTASLAARAFVELAREARESGALTSAHAGPADGFRGASAGTTHRT